METPLSTRLVQIGCTLVWCLLAAGPVFGFAALKPILINEGVYTDRCFSAEDAVSPCVQQDLSLNLMFAVAAVVTNMAALPVGSILDKYGPRLSGIAGSVLIFGASLILSYGKSITLFDPYTIGYSLLALGGPFVFISSFQLANSFPRNSGLILALLTGAFDSSSALFLTYRIVYFSVEKVSLHTFFSYYLVVPVFILVCQLTVMPKDSYKTVGTLAKIGEEGIDETGKPLNPDLLSPEDQLEQYVPTENTSLLRRASIISGTSVKSVYEQAAEAKLRKASGVFGVLHDVSLKDQLQSPWFILMALFTTTQMLRNNYFLATIKAQEEFLIGAGKAESINHFFDMALPIGGILSIPFIGVLLDNFKTITVLYTLLLSSVFIGIMGIIKSEFAAYLGIVVFVLHRPFYYTAVSDYCAKVFGFDTFGTIYGAIICFSGLCNLLQPYLDKVTHEVFKMNPIPINVILIGVTVLSGFSLISLIHTQELNVIRRQLELEAEEATVSEIPN